MIEYSLHIVQYEACNWRALRAHPPSGTRMPILGSPRRLLSTADGVEVSIARVDMWVEEYLHLLFLIAVASEFLERGVRKSGLKGSNNQ